eukprot:g39763.t1
MKQSKTADRDTCLPDGLNAFYARFEQNASNSVSPSPIAPDTPVPSVTASDVTSVSLGVKPKKSMGPDGVPGQQHPLQLEPQLSDPLATISEDRQPHLLHNNINTGVPPKVAFLAPLPYSLYTYGCVAKFRMNTIYKLVEDTTVVGQTSNNDESNYRREIEGLVMWCNDNNLSLNVSKTKELII